MPQIKLEQKDISEIPKGKIISIIGSFDATNTVTTAEEIHKIIDSGSCNLIFDFSKLIHINSAVLGDMIRYKDECNKRGGTICIANASETIFDICQIIGLPSIVEFYESIDEAINDMKR